MITIDKDLRSMQYIIKIDREELYLASMNQENYNNLIIRISKVIYEEMREHNEHIHT